MSLRKLVLLGGLATILGGCVVAPAPHSRVQYEDDYYYSDDDYYDYYNTPSYQGYYYVRVIFIGNTPYYVGDDRHVRPIPRHLHPHFIKYRKKYKDRHAPYFSRDTEVRDGYHMSRMVYFNDRPYYVEDGRVARPMPNHMQERFRYAPLPRFMNNGNNERPMPPQQRHDEQRYERPSYGGEPERNQRPVYGREPERMSPPPFDRGRDDGMRPDNDPRQYERARQPLPNFMNNRPAPNGRGTQPMPPMREERMQSPNDPRGGVGPGNNGSRDNERGREDVREKSYNGRKEQRPAKKKSRGDEDEEDNGSKRDKRRD